MKNWAEYFELSQKNPPSPLLEKALPFLSARKQALDLGAGALRDSKYLLSIGFEQVTAQDQDAQIKKYSSKIPRSLLKFRICNFENIQRLPAQKYNLVNASYSLPFTPPPHLPRLIEQIKKSLQPQGIFCGQFFGPQDSWNHPQNPTKITFTSKAEIQKLLQPLEIIYLKEKLFDGKTIDGTTKTWHVFDFIAQK